MRWRICRYIVRAHAIITIVTTFCSVIKTLLKVIFVRRRNVPRTTSIGFVFDIMTAGSNPDKTLSMAITAAIAPIPAGVSKMRKEILVCRRSFTKDTKQPASNIPTPNDTSTITNDSNNNRMKSIVRSEPSSRRSAISLARKPDCAIVRLM